ncbi:fibronectin type III domain-containing protein [Actinoplanes sp. ATCC 53533]|uniref:fibronectin type III domain-containing protein n=1 Tax=Actinoplanes sp. ATCC 53533 TaxID=1288362 RepID=UPI0013151674|nr:tetratricopeptide repeat protein [Actinoplanes sp. ATCC 53533]
MSQPSPLLAARQRAQALADSGDLGQARAVLEHAVDLGRANLGEDDPDVLLTAQQLAAVHQRADDPSAARRVLEEAYAAGQWRLGDTDPVMLGISFDLGVVAEEMENRHEARRAFGRVAAHGPAVLGADHWAVVRARSYLGEEPATVRMEVPAEQLRRFQRATQDQQAPVRPQPPVTEPPPPSVPERPSHPVPPAFEGPGPPPAGGFPSDGYPPLLEPGYSGQAGYEQPHPMPQIASAPPVAAPVPAKSGDSAYSRRAPAIFAAIAAVCGVIIAVVALVVVLADRGDDPASDVPTLSGPAPSDVRMRDYGSSVKLSWADPANGRASFVVTGGRPGEQLRPMGQVGPTSTSFDLNGLNADLDYCFAIVAVYTTSQFATSPQLCTSRSPGSGEPTPSKR